MDELNAALGCSQMERIGFKTVRQKGSHAFQRVLSVLLRNAGNNIRDFVD